MAQPKLDIIIAAVIREAGDEFATLFDASEVLEAINRARGTVYTEVLTAMKDPQVFMDLYPEFNGMEALSIVTNVITKTAAIRRAIKIMYPSTNPTHIIEAVPIEQSLDAMFPAGYSKWKGTATRPVFIESTGSLSIIGITITGTVSGIVNYLKQPVNVSSGGDDIIEPYIWIDMIVAEAVKTLYRMKQG